MKTIGLLGTAALLTAIAAPASAASVVTTNCISVADAAGCLFSGNINGNGNAANVNSYLHSQNSYNAIRNPDIALTLITGTDAGNFGTFGSFTGAGTASGTWNLPGWNVQYIAVKASPGFVLYQTSGSSGNWDTFDIPFNNNPHAISHLMFFGERAVAVPEPGAWALLILGFGALGATLRRRRPAQAKLHFA